MSQHASFALLPPNFPPELAAAAFIAGTDTAWRPAAAMAAVEWFGSNGYAVLGTELWLLQDGGIQSLPKGLSGLGEAHGNHVDRKNNYESWNTYAVRTAAETAAYLKSFNPADIVEEGDLHFEVTWISESDYERLVR